MCISGWGVGGFHFPALFQDAGRDAGREARLSWSAGKGLAGTCLRVIAASFEAAAAVEADGLVLRA